MLNEPVEMTDITPTEMPTNGTTAPTPAPPMPKLVANLPPATISTVEEVEEGLPSEDPKELSVGFQLRCGEWTVKCSPNPRDGLPPIIGVFGLNGGLIKLFPELKPALDLCRAKSPYFVGFGLPEPIPTTNWTPASN